MTRCEQGFVLAVGSNCLKSGFHQISSRSSGQATAKVSWTGRPVQVGSE